MISRKDFYIEEEFNYKGIKCYYGLTDLGFRTGYIEFDANDFNITSDQLDFADITYSIESNGEVCQVIAFDYGHIHNLYDLEALKEYFPDIYNKNKEKLEERNKEKREYGNFILGTKEMCEEKCKEIVDYLSRFKKEI